MEPNTLIEQIFSRFTIQSPILRDIKLTSEVEDGVTKLVILESFDSNINTIPVVGRTYKLPMSVEALNIGKLLVSLVGLERSIIRTATVNIKNFDFLGIFDPAIVNIGTHEFKVTQDVELFCNYLTLSLDELGKIFFTKNTNANSYFVLKTELITENKLSIEDENEKYTRVFKYIGKDFEIIPEMFKTTFNTSHNIFKLVVEHKYNNGSNIVTNTVLDTTLKFNIHESIAAVSEMKLVEPAIINTTESILGFNKDVSAITYNTLEGSISVTEPFLEEYTKPEIEITAKLSCNLFINSPNIHLCKLQQRTSTEGDWVDSSIVPVHTVTKNGDLSYEVGIVVPVIIPETPEDPANEKVYYKLDVACFDTGTVTTMLFSTNWAANAVPLKLKK